MREVAECVGLLTQFELTGAHIEEPVDAAAWAARGCTSSGSAFQDFLHQAREAVAACIPRSELPESPKPTEANGSITRLYFDEDFKEEQLTCALGSDCLFPKPHFHNPATPGGAHCMWAPDDAAEYALVEGAPPGNTKE